MMAVLKLMTRQTYVRFVGGRVLLMLMFLFSGQQTASGYGATATHRVCLIAPKQCALLV